MAPDEGENSELRMTFDPNTIQHLGLKMYSQLPTAIAELVANAYDACASKVEIKLLDDGENKSIVVSDDGSGMSFEELNKQFLIIGRNRRDYGLKETECNRIASGKKGLGKLALFGIGGVIEIETTRRGSEESTTFSMVWDDISSWDRVTKGPDYKPTFKRTEISKNSHGTTITIRDLKRKTGIDDIYLKDTATSLSRLFNFLDNTFQVTVSLNDGETINVTNEFENLVHQFSWTCPDFFAGVDTDYIQKNNISGVIFTTKKPLSNKKQGGITLFAHGRRVNAAEFFGYSESSNFFSYATGWLDVDFVDNFDEDLISTDRKSLNWEYEELIPLRNFLKSVVGKIHSEWCEMRKEANKNDTKEESGVDRVSWLATLPPDKAQIIDAAFDEMANPDPERSPVSILEDTAHKLAPQYAERHWRYLHSKITENEAIDRLYRGKNYFQAASEAAKLYVEEVRFVADISTAKELSDNNMMGMAYGKDSTKVISLTDRVDAIELDIEQGQMYYSQGVVTGFKNPVTSHATESQLKNRGLFTEKDCLDVMSLISHMLDRLENRTKPLSGGTS